MRPHCRTPFAVAVAAAVLVQGCGSPPPPPPPVVAPEPTPPPAPPPAPPAPTEAAFQTRLPNGLTLLVAAAQAGEQAQLHLAFLVGNAFVAPGLAELAAAALVHGADASRGRQSLSQAVQRLGGVVRTAVGATTTCIEVRVPRGRWRQAQSALFEALEAPPLPRSQLERIRDDVVQARCDAIRSDPMRAMAMALLLAAPDTSSRVSALLDRDASEVGLFQARLLRPERTVLALQVPGVPSEIGAGLAAGAAGTPGAWTPAPLTGPEPRILPHAFQPGFYWSPDPDTPTTEVAWLQFLPPLWRPDAADLLTLHACCTLDGYGGRLEQLQRDRGLGQVQWRSEFVHSAETFALLLRTTVPTAQVEPLQQVLLAARNSLRDVPPSASELELGRRRAALTAGLGQLDSLAQQRVQTRIALLGGSMAAFESRLAQLLRPGVLDVARAADEYLDLPAMCIAIGGAIPDDIPGVRQFRLLPAGLGPTRTVDAAQQAVAATPWIERASEAVSGRGLLRRLIGYRFEARLLSQQAPPAEDRVSWQVDGTLHRTRRLLGKEIETRLEDTTWVERLGDASQSLAANEAALLRREMERHPLALLAACDRGELTFQTVAQRSVGDRDYMILQAQGDRFDRLRIHLDTVSQLVRVVEVWETMPDGTVVHLQDNWSDYRTTDGLRAPFRRVTTQDDGQNSVETQFTSWTPVLSAP
ncbi:MAG: insulinase family protein [Planctomycetes bacterium]|nr:insulinase family protein [Planctomycetota bacterium]